MQQTVLFVCIHNSARSQMAEAWLSHLYGDRFAAASAGLEPGVLNPYAVRAMAEAGINIAQASTKSVFAMAEQGRQFDYVITVCDKEAAERCPFFPGRSERLHWSFAGIRPKPPAAMKKSWRKLAPCATKSAPRSRNGQPAYKAGQ